MTNLVQIYNEDDTARLLADLERAAQEQVAAILADLSDPARIDGLLADLERACGGATANTQETNMGTGPGAAGGCVETSMC